MNENSRTSIDVLFPPPKEPDQSLNELTRAVIGAGIEVHRHLGPGLTEPLYEAAFKHEFESPRHPF